MSFPLHTHPSVNLLPAPHPRKDLRPRVVNGHPSPDSGSSDCNSELPRVKLGPNGLAEDQPPTAQGKMRTRVYVACLQCRSRKIRCDGAKPKCQKCARRSSECDYDAAPKRRGPDKKPGARQRTSKKAKAAKEEAARKQGGSVAGTSDQTSQGIEENEGTISRKRRKPSDSRGSVSPSHPAWSGDSDDPANRKGSIAASSASDGATPLTPRDVAPAPIRLTPIPDFPIHISTGRPLVPSHVSQPRQSASYSTVNLNFHYLPSARIEVVDELDELEEHERLHRKRKWDPCPIGGEPSLDFSRKTWWDSLLATYTPGSDRVIAYVFSDLDSFAIHSFKSSNYFLSFFNVPLFFSVFCNPVERDKMQPSLVLAGLAMATFMRSSELNGGSAGRLRAMWLRDAAQSALEASFNAQWIEPTLAQAAWLLALFEMCAHPYHSSQRSNSAMVMLDSIIRTLSLTTIDANESAVSVFSLHTVPVVLVPSSSRVSRQEGCSCRSLTLGHNSRSSYDHTPLWVATPAWNPDWTVSEIRKEESRRLCWSSLQLAAGHTSHAAAFSAPPLDYFCIEPANYALLFPGEALLQSHQFSASHSAKESVWALYSRAMFLWNSCLRMRGEDVSENDKATFAVNAWIESTAIEEALDAHTCGCDQAFLFQGREFLFITRMCISYEFRRYIPHPESEVCGLFNRKKAEAWLLHQATVAKRMMQGLHTVTGHKNNILAQRPFFVWWFMGQVARSLTLWQCDNSLLLALEVCQAYFPPIDYLSCLWPCPAQRSRYLGLHSRLAQACRMAGISAPPAPNFDLLAPGSPPVSVV
ncbi:hypothetical protein K439DRAFT_1350360 [Ramaria rubella]|nr:hypothetical protein K439DRAFT_1350360 [Ramaria rubella]